MCLIQAAPKALTDLLAGRIQLVLGAASTFIPQVAAGKLDGIGMAQLKRSPAAPDVPTISEQGLTGFDASLWFGLEAPAGTPREIIDKLANAANEAIKSDEGADRAACRNQGIELFLAVRPGRVPPATRSTRLRNGEASARLRRIEVSVAHDAFGMDVYVAE